MDMGATILSATQEKTTLESYQLRRLVRAIVTARAEEIACDECFEQLDCFVEMTLAGMDSAQAVSLVQDHLERCHDCREEFETLLTVLHAFA
jgi:hypothetical protein